LGELENLMSKAAGPSQRLSTAPIDKLFNPKAAAILGASPNPAKLGSTPLAAITNLGYQGEIFAINPRYQEVGGYPCVATVDDLPPQVESVMVMLPADAAVDAVEACAKNGIRGIVLVSQGFGEAGEAGIERDRKVTALAREYDLAICGPNTNGLANIGTGLATSMAPSLLLKNRVRPGRVGLISQSGAMVSNLVSKTSARGIGISKTVTCGNELILGVADYLGYLADDPDTDIIVLFLETIRNAEALKEALARCRARGKPVVAVKVGESESGQKAALSHTGAIAGSYRNTVAFLEHEGVVVAESVEIMAATVELLLRFKWPLETPSKPFMISISGGFAAVAADEMARLGLSLPEMSEAATAELGALPNQSLPVNPYDLTTRNELIPEIVDIFRRDGFNQMLFGLSLLKNGIREYVQKLLVEVKQNGFDHIYAISPETDPDERKMLQDNGISVSDDTVPLFMAMRKLAAYRGPSRTIPAATPLPLPVTLPDTPGLMDEAASKTVLAKLGLAVPASVIVDGDPDLAVLKSLSRPLAIKGLSNSIAHKTEHGIVAIGLNSDDEIIAGWQNVRAALAQADSASTRLLVEEMVLGGLEAIVGIQHDPVVGPVVIVGAGGILVELLGDAVVLVPPFTKEEVLAALEPTKFGRLLKGYRGKTYDGNALANATVLLGALALEKPGIESVDVNPLFVQESGVIAIDAKITLS